MVVTHRRNEAWRHDGIVWVLRVVKERLSFQWGVRHTRDGLLWLSSGECHRVPLFRGVCYGQRQVMLGGLSISWSTR